MCAVAVHARRERAGAHSCGAVRAPWLGTFPYPAAMPEPLDNSPATVPRVGCASWSLSRLDRAHFPEDGSHLERYAALFNAAEINSSFYKPHKPATYERWRDSVPDRFRYSVKLPKAITHEKRLADIDEDLAHFADEARHLGPKLAWILVQLPPKLAFDPQVALPALERIQRAFPDPVAVALEARNASWFTHEATALLSAMKLTRVVADPVACAPAAVHVPTSDAFYIRLHGSPRVYYSSYEDDYLAQMARAMREHTAAGRQAWCVFDNTAGQAAVPNGLTLLRYLAG
jgi:uncharacterized protein YecE (DUF72 family)